MDSTTVSDRQGPKNNEAAPPTRDHPRQDQTRQVAADNAVRQQERRAINNREAARRRAHSAMRESIVQDRALERQNMEAGVEKMVRSVVRQESGQDVQRQPQETAQQKDARAQARYVRDKLNSAYRTDAAESHRDESQRPPPSQHQQQRAVENYQESNRNSIDRTVELVI